MDSDENYVLYEEILNTANNDMSINAKSLAKVKSKLTKNCKAYELRDRTRIGKFN